MSADAWKHPSWILRSKHKTSRSPLSKHKTSRPAAQFWIGGSPMQLRFLQAETDFFSTESLLLLHRLQLLL
jgi:hypothetical protein